MATRCRHPTPTSPSESGLAMARDAVRARAVEIGIVTARAALSPESATALVRWLAREGIVTWSRHGLDQAAAAGVTTLECDQALIGGIADPPEYRQGWWRYRIHWRRLCVVVVFRSDVEAVVVDAWRKQR